MTLPSEAQARKDLPITTGVLDYFPDALAEVARVSKAGNDQHNPGQPLHWAKGKSTDHADCLVRHLLERGTLDSDGTRHSAKVAWRALALLQMELEAEQEENTPPRPGEDRQSSDGTGVVWTLNDDGWRMREKVLAPEDRLPLNADDVGMGAKWEDPA